MENSQTIQIIRRFNRFYTNILGLLDQHVSNSEFSLSEGRVLFEIGNSEKCTAKGLLEQLSMDPGYLSRIIHHLVKKDLIYRQKALEDGRLYYLQLTENGKVMLSKLNQLSDQHIGRMIETLPLDQTRILSDSMVAIEGILSKDEKASRSTIAIRNELKPGDIGYLIHLHGQIYAKECGYNHIFEGYVCKTFYEFLNKYDTTKDRIWFAEDKGRMIGAIAIVGHSEETAQLRWFILLPEYRGMGIGSVLFDEAIQYCKRENYQRIFLETTEDQKTAIKMYGKAGFEKVKEYTIAEWGQTLNGLTYELELGK